MRTKRVKWDNAGDGTAPAAPRPEDLRQKAEAAAARIVAQIKEDKAQSEDVFINDAPMAIRDQLTRRAALVYVEQQTGTSIVIKGRFYPPGAPRDAVNPPLHLHITPQQHLGTDKHNRRNAVARAAAHVHAILRGEASITSPVPPYMAPGGMQPPPDIAHLNPHMAPGPHMPRPFPGAHAPPQQFYQMGPGPGPVGSQFMQKPGMHPGMLPHNQMHASSTGPVSPVGAGMLPPPANLHMPPPGHSGWQNHQGWQQQQQDNRHSHGGVAPPSDSGAPTQAGMASQSGAFIAGQPAPEAVQHSDGAHALIRESQALRSDPAQSTAAQLDLGPGGGASQYADGKHITILPVEFSVPPGFDVIAQLRGPNNSYMAHIERETGASVDVIETGTQQSAMCPVEVHVRAEEPWRQSAAVELINSLLKTVQASANTHSGNSGISTPAPGGPDPSQMAPNPHQPQSMHAQAGYHSSHTLQASVQHAYHMPPQHQPAGPAQARPHMPPPGFIRPGMPGAPMQGQSPSIMHPPPSMPQQPPGLNANWAGVRQTDAGPQSTAQGSQPSARDAGGYRSRAGTDAASEKPIHKPAKRKFREFKEDAGTLLLRQDKTTEDVQLPSYYKHLREGAKATEESEGENARATEHAEVYGPQNAPHVSKGSGTNAANSQYVEAGSRLGLGSKGSGGLVPYGDD